MLKKASIETGKALYNCAKTVSHTTRKIHAEAKTPSPQELLDAAIEWKSTHSNDPDLPPFKSLTPSSGRVPEECRTPTFDEFKRKENRTPEEEKLDLLYGDEHTI